jgi:hypothetical protein
VKARSRRYASSSKLFSLSAGASSCRYAENVDLMRVSPSESCAENVNIRVWLGFLLRSTLILGSPGR